MPQEYQVPSASSIERWLDEHYLKHRRYGNTIVSQCPNPDHVDNEPSAKIFLDNGFVSCFAGCGRFHICKYAEELRTKHPAGGYQSRQNRDYKPRWENTHNQDKDATQSPSVGNNNMNSGKIAIEQQKMMNTWKSLPEIPADHTLHKVSASTLNELGWRYDAVHKRYFIPYWNSDRSKILFAQWRNLTGKVRFNFWPGVPIRLYGQWNITPDTDKILICEGSSDFAVLTELGMPVIATPSASQDKLIKQFAEYCKDNDITIYFAGDNDRAGEKVAESISKVYYYSDLRPDDGEGVKDWGEWYERGDTEQEMLDYLLMKFDPETYFDTYEEPKLIQTIAPAKPVTPEVPKPPIMEAIEQTPEAEVVEKPQPVIPTADQKSKILELFPGSTEISVVGGGKEQNSPTPSIIQQSGGLQKPSGLISSG